MADIIDVADIIGMTDGIGKDDSMGIILVIPCYKEKATILSVLERVGPEVGRIYVVDDQCPEGTGHHVEEHCRDRRVRVLYNTVNLGVGGATKTGYRASLEDGAEIVLKMDGDGQMDPALIPAFLKPIADGHADYVKGNRFYTLESLKGMPGVRLFGNAVLSFLVKMTSGYWNLMDPTNGFTAIHGSILSLLSLDKVDDGYFFETDMLFRLNTIRAVIREIPMNAAYGDEKSSMRMGRMIRVFSTKPINRFLKRVYYNYFLRDFNVCSIELLSSAAFMLFGTVFGLRHWYRSYAEDVVATTGTVMLAALPVILGFQMFLAAVHYDVTNIPTEPLLKRLGSDPTQKAGP